MLCAAGAAAASGCGESTKDSAPRLSPEAGGAGGDCDYCAEAGEGAATPSAGKSQGGSGTEPGGTSGSAGQPPQAEAGQAGQRPDAGGTAGQAGAPPIAVPVPDLALRSITISQTLEIPLVQLGVAVATAKRALPLIASKQALVRASVDVGVKYSARPLIGVLDVKTGAVTRTLVSERTIQQSSVQDDLATSFVFKVDGADLAASSTYRVRVLEQDTTPITRFPETGYRALDAQVRKPFELAIVPYLVGGFGPKLGDAELAGLRQRFLALYPLADVHITVKPAVTLKYVVNGAGDGWDEALDEIYDLRLKAMPADDVFYFGMLAPADSYDTYCDNGCVLGYSNVASETDVDSRGSIGVGVFQDGSGVADAWDTLLHELGHALGRDHAPCGISDPTDVDVYWPEDALHKNAAIGGYGYDFDLTRLVKPKPSKDVMSYCTPVWISDYTYGGIAERLALIAAQTQPQAALRSFQPAQFRLARIRRNGDSRWLGARTKNGAAAPVDVAVLDAQGRTLSTVHAQVARIDHGAGGYVWIPEQALSRSGAVAVDLRPLGGHVLAL